MRFSIIIIEFSKVTGLSTELEHELLETEGLVGVLLVDLEGLDGLIHRVYVVLKAQSVHILLCHTSNLSRLEFLLQTPTQHELTRHHIKAPRILLTEPGHGLRDLIRDPINEEFNLLWFLNEFQGIKPPILPNPTIGHGTIGIVLYEIVNECGRAPPLELNNLLRHLQTPQHLPHMPQEHRHPHPHIIPHMLILSRAILHKLDDF